MSLISRIGDLAKAVGADIKSLKATQSSLKGLATQNITDLLATDSTNQLTLKNNQLYINVANVGTWVDIPAAYLPTDFGNSKNIFRIRRSTGFWELLITCSADINSTSWGTASKNLPTDWIPEFDVQAILTANSGQIGRIWIRASGQIVYTGSNLSSGYGPTVYLRIPTSKAMPSSTL